MGHWYGPNERANKKQENRGMGMNKVILCGRVGKEIETKNIGGNYVAEFTLATSKKWKNKAGESQEKTAWHNIIAWGSVAKIVKEYSSKGKRLIIEGEIDYQSWNKSDGSKGYKTVINANNIEIVDFADKEKNEEQASLLRDQQETDAFNPSDIPF